MSRSRHITKSFALLACLVLLVSTLGCSGDSVVSPVDGFNGDSIESPTGSESTPKGDPQADLGNYAGDVSG
jgi:hypothetical protein